MTDDEVEARVRRVFGPDLPCYLAVDPGFTSLVAGLVRSCLDDESSLRRAREEEQRRLVRVLDAELRDAPPASQPGLEDLVGSLVAAVAGARRGAVGRCAEFLRRRGACYLADRMTREVA